MDIGKRLWSLLVIAVAIVSMGLFVAGDTRTGLAAGVEPPDTSPVSASQETPVTNWTPVFECFNLRDGHSPNVAARLITENFGGDLVRVQDLVMLCELGRKYDNPDATAAPEPDSAIAPVVLACYRIRRGSDPNDPFVLNTKNFGEDRVIVRQATVMCEQAAKSTTDQGAPLPPNPRVWECFDINNGDNPDVGKLVVTRNFGPDRVHVGPLGLMCEAAKKLRQRDGTIEETGLASGDVFACYRLRRGLDPDKRVTLTTKNFGSDTVLVRQAAMLCEQARKTPVYDLPADISGPGNE